MITKLSSTLIIILSIFIILIPFVDGLPINKCRPFNYLPQICRCEQSSSSIILRCTNTDKVTLLQELNYFRGINIETLEIAHIPINTLDSDQLAGFSVARLSLVHCKINFYHGNAFRGLKGALLTLNITEEFDVASNAFRLPSQSFKSLEKLATLSLNINTLGVISNYDFRGLSELRSLTVISRKLKILQEFAFYGLSQLTYLYLDGHENFGLNMTILAPLVGLEYIYVSSPAVYSMPANLLENCKNLSQIHLHYCSLEGLSHQFFQNNPRMIKEISLYHNKLTTVNGVFDNLTHLAKLDLSNNELAALTDNSFKGLHGLQSLKLSFNKFSSMSGDTFRDLQSLKELVLSYNRKLENLSDAVFESLRKLEKLDISASGLETLPTKLLSFNQNLTYLDISNNYLNKLDSNLLTEQQSLVTLKMSQNRLQTLPSDLFKNLVRLQILDLSDNKLFSLNPYLFQTSPNLQKLKLKGNPWRCDCQMVKFMKNYKIWVDKMVDNYDRTSLVNDAKHSLCSYPTSMSGYKLMDLTTMKCSELGDQIVWVDEDKHNSTLIQNHKDFLVKIYGDMKFSRQVAIVSSIISFLTLSVLCLLFFKYKYKPTNFIKKPIMSDKL